MMFFPRCRSTRWKSICGISTSAPRISPATFTYISTFTRRISSTSCSHSDRTHDEAVSHASPATRRCFVGPKEQRLNEDHGDKFYLHYLNWKLQPMSFVLCPWLADLEHPTHDAVRQLKLLDAPSTETAQAQRVLEDFIAVQHQSGRPKDDQREAFQHAKVGSRALNWFLHNTEKLDLVQHPHLNRVLMHCLVAENGEQYIWKLIASRDAPMYADKYFERNTKWRSTALRFFLESATFWERSITTGMGTAIQHLRHSFDIEKTIRETRDSNQFHFDLSLATTWVLKPLSGLKWPTSFAQDYNNFINYVGFWASKPIDRLLLKSRLEINHPVKPTADLFVRFLESESEAQNGSPRVKNFLNPQGYPGACLMVNIFTMAAQVLNRQNELGQAQWVLDRGRALRPDLFSGKPFDFRHAGLHDLASGAVLNKSATATYGAQDRMYRMRNLKKRDRLNKKYFESKE